MVQYINIASKQNSYNGMLKIVYHIPIQQMKCTWISSRKDLGLDCELMFEDLGLASRMGDSVELMNLKINDELHGPSDGPIRKLTIHFLQNIFFHR